MGSECNKVIVDLYINSSKYNYLGMEQFQILSEERHSLYFKST